MPRPRVSLAIFAAAAAVGLALVAPQPSALANVSGLRPAARTSDPLEGMNRRLYAVHRVLEAVVVRPALYAFSKVTPRPLRAGLSHAFRNLGEPLTAMNDLLQLRPGRAARAAGRFAANSTLGVAGLVDVAAAHGLPYHASDFGQTLGRYGVRGGPYVFVPVLGPSTARDVTGRVADAALDPFGYLSFTGRSAVSAGRLVMSTADRTAREATQAAEAPGEDPYLVARSSYLNAREASIRPGGARLARSFWREDRDMDAGDAEAEPPAPADYAAVADSFFQPIR